MEDTIPKKIDFAHDYLRSICAYSLKEYRKMRNDPEYVSSLADSLFKDTENWRTMTIQCIDDINAYMPRKIPLKLAYLIEHTPFYDVIMRFADSFFRVHAPELFLTVGKYAKHGNDPLFEEKYCPSLKKYFSIFQECDIDDYLVLEHHLSHLCANQNL